MARSSPEIRLVPAADIPASVPVDESQYMDACVLGLKMEWLCEREGGIGLSAVQVGSPMDLFVVRRGRSSYEHYVNCRYEGIGETQKTIEGCLSLRTKENKARHFEVDRHSKVRVTGKMLRLTDSGHAVADEVDLVLDGLMAIVFQHEIDHGLGILISDKGREIEVLPNA